MPDLHIGVFLPTFVGADGRTGKDIAAFARCAEQLGFDSVWATDHLLHGSLFYRVPWLEPLLSLTYAACATEHVRLGTSILVLPVRQPVLLAKQISTLRALSDDRFILGAGTGWDPREFAAAGSEKRSRGSMTDEVLTIVRKLSAGESVTYEGRHFKLDDVAVEPAAQSPLQVWVAGGRQLPDPKSPEPPAMARSVLARIAGSEGWIARPTATPEQISEDVHEIQEFMTATGRDVASLTLAHENFLHYVPTDDPEEARHAQHAAFTNIMGERRPFDYFEKVYLTGTRDEVVKKIHERLDSGIHTLMLHTLEPTTEQLKLWAEELLPQIRSHIR